MLPIGRVLLSHVTPKWPTLFQLLHLPHGIPMPYLVDRLSFDDQQYATNLDDACIKEWVNRGPVPLLLFRADPEDKSGQCLLLFRCLTPADGPFTEHVTEHARLTMTNVALTVAYTPRYHLCFWLVDFRFRRCFPNFKAWYAFNEIDTSLDHLEYASMLYRTSSSTDDTDAIRCCCNPGIAYSIFTRVMLNRLLTRPSDGLSRSLMWFRFTLLNRNVRGAFGMGRLQRKNSLYAANHVTHVLQDAVTMRCLLETAALPLTPEDVDTLGYRGIL
jgi:hypothetical protein